MTINVTARPRCLPLCARRTARRSRTASRGTDIRRTHLLWLYVVSRGYTLYREAIRCIERNRLFKVLGAD
jgi:hypothetical protein